MKKIILPLIVLTSLTCSVFAENLVVNPEPAAENMEGYKYACIVEGPDLWKQFEFPINEEGAMVLDNSKVEGLKMGVFTIEVKELEEGKSYVFKVDIKADKWTGVIVGLPTTDPEGKTDKKGNPKGQSQWTKVPAKWKTISVPFTYRKGMDKSAVTLLMLEKNVDDTFYVKNPVVMEQP